MCVSCTAVRKRLRLSPPMVICKLYTTVTTARYYGNRITTIRNTDILQFELRHGSKHGNVAIPQLVACACFVRLHTNAASSTVAISSICYNFDMPYLRYVTTYDSTGILTDIAVLWLIKRHIKQLHRHNH